MDSSRATISRRGAHPRRAWSSTVTFCPSVFAALTGSLRVAFRAARSVYRGRRLEVAVSEWRSCTTYRRSGGAN